MIARTRKETAMKKTKSAGSGKVVEYVNVRLPMPPELEAKIRVNA